MFLRKFLSGVWHQRLESLSPLAAAQRTILAVRLCRTRFFVRVVLIFAPERAFGKTFVSCIGCMDNASVYLEHLCRQRGGARLVLVWSINGIRLSRCLPEGESSPSLLYN